MKKTTLLSTLAISGLTASITQAASIAGTGWNADMIVEASATNSGTGITAATSSSAWSSWVMAEVGFAGIGSTGTVLDTGLPTNGLLTSKNGTAFQLQSYTANNTLLGGSTFTLTTPGSFSDIQFLWTGVNGSFVATLNFSDTSTTELTATVADWQSGNSTNAHDDEWAYVRRGSTDTIDLWHRELAFTLSAADSAKTIDSITFGANSRFGISAINGTLVPEPSSTALLGLGGLALILRRRK